jgi:hypothetical protein
MKIFYIQSAYLHYIDTCFNMENKMAQDRDQWRALVDTVTKFRVP